MNENFKEFKKVNKESLSDQIIQQIKEMIEKGILKPDDRLPAERELAVKLGVSRIPLREALKTLQFINVLEIRPGEGYVVKGLETVKLLDILDVVCEPEQDVLDDLKEMRMTLELKAVELACLRRTEKDLGRMVSAIENMGKNMDTDHKEMIQASIDFHNAIMKASHNKLFVSILAWFSDIINEGREKSGTIENRYKKAIEEHRAIYNAIKNRDCDTALSYMKTHLETIYYSDNNNQ